MQQNGLHVQSPVGDFVVEPVTATDDPEQVGPVDLILVCAKSYDVLQVAKMLQPLMMPNTVLIPVQNGIEHIGQLGSVLGPEHVLGGVSLISAQMIAPGSIEHHVVHAFAQGLDDWLRRPEIHVHHPHGQHILIILVPLEAVGAAPVDQLIKIGGHRVPPHFFSVIAQQSRPVDGLDRGLQPVVIVHLVEVEVQEHPLGQRANRFQRNDGVSPPVIDNRGYGHGRR